MDRSVRTRRGSVSIEYVLLATLVAMAAFGSMALPQLLAGMMVHTSEATGLGDPAQGELLSAGVSAPDNVVAVVTPEGLTGDGFDDVDDPWADPGDDDGAGDPEARDGDDPAGGFDPVGDDDTPGNGKGNNGHGNNEDGVDVSNPGQGHGGPNGRDDPSGDVDDEAGGGCGNGASSGKAKGHGKDR